MHLFISLFLIIYAGWTVSAHICVLLGLNLNALLLLTPFVVTSLLGAYYYLLKTKKQFLHSPGSSWNGVRYGNKNLYIFSLVALTALPVALYLSWIIFWALSVLILIFSLFRGDEKEVLINDAHSKNLQKFNFLILALLVLSAIYLSFAVSRSDLDDASYVAISAFLSSNPTHAILSIDPMLGEPDFPLILSSLRFTTFELLSGAIAYVLSVPAMNVYYIYLLPVWAVAAVVSIFLLTKEMIPRHWLLAGVVALLLILLLGEMHRSPANFSFVRIFQGKAVFLSVIVPTIFYLTARFFSERGTKADMLLLACCQVASIGLSGFGMLMGPIVGFGALVSNIPLILKGDRKKLYYAFVALLIPLPYLISVALDSYASPIMNFRVENAAQVWVSVFGSHQQYLVGFLIMAGPVLARDSVTRWRIAIPSLLLFAIYLNPWLASFISEYITSPPVYWRVIWSFPILIYAAISFCMIVGGLFNRKSSRLPSVVLTIAAFSMLIYALPFNTLRFENIGAFQGFATWKVPSAHLIVAKKVIEMNSGGGRLLAPDEIAGVISRFEERPRLISTRGFYIKLFKPLVGEEASAPRQLLYDFVMGQGDTQTEKVRSAIRSLDVSVIIFRVGTETNYILNVLEPEGFKLRESLYGYTIWTRRLL